MFGPDLSGHTTLMALVTEHGDIFFCYRPRVDVQQAHGPDDVQRFFAILKPVKKPSFRRIILGRKRLPAVEDHERTWGFVDLVTANAEELEDELDPYTYETKTRGTRVEPAARPAGEGVYAVVDHDGHTHIAYALELPEMPGPVQAELGIRLRASMIVTVRNPDAPRPQDRPSGLPPTRRPTYPDELREKFGSHQFIALDPPDFLDYPGTELVLIGAGEDVTRELGIALPTRRETRRSADVFTELGMEPDVHPVEPLLTGEWK
jgi:hypothetical protein